MLVGVLVQGNLISLLLLIFIVDDQYLLYPSSFLNDSKNISLTYQVIQNITALSQIADRAKFTTASPIGPAQNRLANKEPSKWDKNISTTPTYVGELGMDVETKLKHLINYWVIESYENYKAM